MMRHSNFLHLFGWLVLIWLPHLTARLAIQTTSVFVSHWAQLVWLARALNGRKLAGANCAGDLGQPTVRMLG